MSKGSEGGKANVPAGLPVDVSTKDRNRIIRIGGSEKNKFCNNEVITSRYTFYNFLPKNLLEQFQNIANVYFLLLTMLQCVPAVSITGGVPTILPPLMFVLSVNALKDGIEDWRRHQSDNEENLRTTEYAGDSKSGDELPSKTWRQVEVGDIVCVRGDEPIPCDLVLLGSSDPHGIAYVETANLDGETNLKMKQAQDQIVGMLNIDKDRVEACKKALKFSGQLECELPNRSLYTFEGTLEVSLAGTSSGSPSKVPLGEHQQVLRGSRLRNTEWAIGLVVYTGKETKIQMNSSGRQPRKVSEVERKTQQLTMMIFSLQMFFCVIAASINASFATSESTAKLTYLNLLGEDGQIPSVASVFFPRIGTFVLIFANFIPISLIVTTGLVKLGQVFFMHKDADMVHQSQNSVPRTSDLNEELGQVEYIFSDKTGTLTCNIMEFRRFAVAGEPYGEGLTEIRRNVLRREGRPVPPDPRPPPGSAQTPNVNFVDGRLEMVMSDPHHPSFQELWKFYLSLAINHAVMPEHKKDKSGSRKLTYSASSPDEVALVYFAKHCGFELCDRDPTGIHISSPAGEFRVQILANLEFTSRRKRSSVVCRYADPTEPSKGMRYVIHCKGADTVIEERLSPECLKTHEATGNFAHMAGFAEDGLRTLCIASREITAEDFESWNERYREATLAMEHRQTKIERVCEEIETNLTLLGITGIEDRLQDGVGETILALQRAGVKTWMLTGDKAETAVNIGVATGLLPPRSEASVRPLLNFCEISTDDVTHSVYDPKELMDLAMQTAADMERTESMALEHQEAVVHADKAKKGLFARKGKYTFEAENASADLLEDLKLKMTAYKSAMDGGDTKEIGILGSKLQQVVATAMKFRLVRKMIRDSRDSTQHPNGFEALIIDGSALVAALEPEVANMFAQLCMRCRTVICCRVSPQQKGTVVRLMRAETKGAITLAIGDGANDCNMIQAASVGVGIRGEEGLQAFNVCDYGIGQFRFLQPLLLCHGRWSYRRVSKLVLYMFYKNIVIVLPQYFLNVISHFSGQKLYHDAMYQTYNVFFTFLPVVFFGIFDQDVSKECSLACPELYQLGQERHYFNNVIFVQWIVNGIWHAVVVFFVPYYTFAEGAIPSPDGKSPDLWLLGTVVFFLVMVVVNLKILIESYLLIWVTWFGIALSLLAWILLQSMLSMYPGVSYEAYGSMGRLFASPTFPMVVLLTSIIAVSRDVHWKTYKRTWCPELYHEVQRQVFQNEASLKKQGRSATFVEPSKSGTQDAAASRNDKNKSFS